jgi:hypothetical protein
LLGEGYDVVNLIKRDFSRGVSIKMEWVNQISDSRAAGAASKYLYKVGAIAAFMAAVLFRRNMDAEYLLLRGVGIIHTGPTIAPSMVVDWFALLNQNKLLGLTLLNIFDLVNYALLGLIFLATAAALQQTSKSLMTIVTALGFLGIMIYLGSNQALSMLSLSNQYASATTAAHKSTLLAAGRSSLALHENVSYQGNGMYISFFLVSMAGLILSVVMFQSDVFSKACASMGITANLLGIGYYLTSAFIPTLVYLPVSLSALFLLAWYLMISERLWVLGSRRLGA